MSNQQTSMEDLLSRRVVDERERSPDDQPSIAETSEPEAFENREAFTNANEPKQKAEAKPDPQPKPQLQAKEEDDGGAESESRRMSGLPKWAYMRLQANNQKAEAAERRAAELESRLKALEMARQQPGQQEEEEETWDQWTKKEINSVKAELERQNWDQRNAFGWQLAQVRHGEDLPREATGWANDRAKADPAFARQVFQAADPVDFCINEFKKAQFADEAAKFGWDLDKLVQARAGTQQPRTQQTQPQQPAAGVSAAASQSEPRMPSDFASTGTGAGRVNGDAGPTPLSDLLNINRGRR